MEWDEKVKHSQHKSTNYWERDGVNEISSRFCAFESRTEERLNIGTESLSATHAGWEMASHLSNKRDILTASIVDLSLDEGSSTLPSSDSSWPSCPYPLFYSSCPHSLLRQKQDRVCRVWESIIRRVYWPSILELMRSKCHGSTVIWEMPQKRGELWWWCRSIIVSQFTNFKAWFWWGQILQSIVWRE